jgi:hypothetical protein
MIEPMQTLRSLFPAALIVLCSCSAARSDVPASSPASQPASVALSAASSLDDILVALHQRGDTLSTLKSRVLIGELDPALGKSLTRIGQIWVDRSTPGDPKVRVQLLFKVDGDKHNERIDDKIEYLLAGDWLIDRTYGAKSEAHRQIRKPGEKLDVLKLGEGPIPLPIGQSPDEVRKQFEVTQLPARTEMANGRKLPDDSLIIELRPKQDTSLQKRLESITLWIDPALALPIAIETRASDGVTTKSTVLQDVKLNEPVLPTDFTLDPIETDWSVTREAFTE